jgi:FkbM family methyltransferase
MSHWKYGFQTHELREAFLIREYGLGPAEHDYQKHNLIMPGDVYVEAGAYIGRSGYLAQAMGARVVLIEASPEHIDCIKRNMRLRGLNATLIEKALWSEEGFGYFTTNGGSGNRLTKDFRPKEYYYQINPTPENTVGVYVTTLPQILKELKIGHVNLFACDIEGAETEVVKTLDPEVELNVAIASYHLGSVENVQKYIIGILKNKGYKDITYEDGIVFGSAKSFFLK